MSTTIDRSAALVAPPRPRVSLADACLRADDVQPRLANRPGMKAPAAAWRLPTGPTMRGIDLVVPQGTTKAGRAGIAGAAYVTTQQHFSTRSGPPTSRPPA